MKKRRKKHTYSPNDARLASFGLYLVVVALQHPPSRVLRRLYPENTIKHMLILKTQQKKRRKHTYSPNDARLASFGLFLVVRALPCGRCSSCGCSRVRCHRVCCCLMVVDKEVIRQ
jgi:hypothetical protein